MTANAERCRCAWPMARSPARRRWTTHACLPTARQRSSSACPPRSCRPNPRRWRNSRDRFPATRRRHAQARGKRLPAICDRAPAPRCAACSASRQGVGVLRPQSKSARRSSARAPPHADRQHRRSPVFGQIGQPRAPARTPGSSKGTRPQRQSFGCQTTTRSSARGQSVVGRRKCSRPVHQTASAVAAQPLNRSIGAYTYPQSGKAHRAGILFRIGQSLAACRVLPMSAQNAHRLPDSLVCGLRALQHPTAGRRALQ